MNGIIGIIREKIFVLVVPFSSLNGDVGQSSCDTRPSFIFTEEDIV